MQKFTDDSMEIILRQMDLWYQSLPGSELLLAEREELDKILPRYFGGHLLQVGGSSETFIFEKSPIWHKIRYSPEYAPVFRGPSVQGKFHQWPFLPESIDVILLPHVLEFVPKPEQVLQQSQLSLTPDGHLIILGFNPCSLWGLMKCWGRRKTLPWRGRFNTLWRMRHSLAHQGFEVEEVRTLFFRPPLSSKRWLRRLLALEVIGRLLWSNCGAVYLIVAKKRLVPLIPIKSSAYRKRHAFNSSFGRIR
ncbi:MAG TPA: methyltransferase domain-containing protein [Gammaproteobacteria bacterium]|nr:methyltransferase domain-containing protein [Gammaproteobacteria bacterium]